MRGNYVNEYNRLQISKREKPCIKNICKSSLSAVIWNTTPLNTTH
jgi:hypothetical protein